jgi:hypothetical protein
MGSSEETYKSAGRHPYLVGDYTGRIRPSLNRQCRFSRSASVPVTRKSPDDSPDGYVDLDPDAPDSPSQAESDLSTSIQAEAALGSIGAEIDTLSANLITSVVVGELEL